MTVRDDIERHPRPVSLDRDLLLRCIDDCYDCSATCTGCADACLGEPDALDLTRSIRLNLDCADICDGVGRILTRQTDRSERRPGSDRGVRLACRARAVECERYAAHHDHCRVCAEVCRRCEQTCRDLLASIG